MRQLLAVGHAGQLAAAAAGSHQGNSTAAPWQVRQRKGQYVQAWNSPSVRFSTKRLLRAIIEKVKGIIPSGGIARQCAARRSKAGADMTIKEIAAMCGVSRGHGGPRAEPPRPREARNRAAVRAAAGAGGLYQEYCRARAHCSPPAPRIGVVLCCLGNPFFDEVLKGISQAEEELQDWGVRVELRLLRGYDAAAQLQAMEELKDCAALILQPINAEAVRAKIAALADAGVPSSPSMPIWRVAGGLFMWERTITGEV